jgi:gag-polyprotein putative aspartyl protease
MGKILNFKLTIMKKIITTLTILNLIIAPVFAQESSGCFLIDENGQYQSLKDLCPSSETPIVEEKKENSPVPPTVDNPNSEIPNSEENKTDKTEQNGAFFTVPIKKRIGGIPLIDVTFNRNKTFEMLLDTGATVTTITEKMGNELKIKPQQTIPIATAGGIIKAGLSKVESMKAGNLQVNNLLISISSNLPFGLLGQNFYSEYDVTIKENLVEFHSRKPQ